MRILLDESLPLKLHNSFSKKHEVSTVKDEGWLGKKNGELLKLITTNDFELFVTVDRNLQYQQNLKNISFTLVVLCAPDNRLTTLQKLVKKIFERIAENNLQNVIEIY
jgi:predicted nuclease of predicted toxin-antitoxin system